MSWRAVAPAALALSMSFAGAALAADKQQLPAKPNARAVATAPAARPAAAPAAATDLSEEQRGYIDQAIKDYVAPRFTVLADDLLDADQRAAAEAMQAEHLPRVRALMERWTIEEAQQPSPQRALFRMLARLANEFALWGRDSGGPAHDAALAQALQMPGMCRPVGPRASELVMRLSRFRGLPAPVQRQALQAEADLLTRWGQPRQVDETEPLAAEDLLLQLRITAQPPKVPLPPVLAYHFLGDEDATRKDPLLADPSVRCALHQWAGANPAEFRAAMAMQAADLLWANRREAAAPTSDDERYPRLAGHFGIRGVITVHADVNPQGQVVRAKVAKRAVQVPGIRNARPFAHEAVLDLASLAKAREMDWSAAALKEGLTSVAREFQWSLPWE